MAYLPLFFSISILDFFGVLCYNEGIIFWGCSLKLLDAYCLGGGDMDKIETRTVLNSELKKYGRRRYCGGFLSGLYTFIGMYRIFELHEFLVGIPEMIFGLAFFAWFLVKDPEVELTKKEEILSKVFRIATIISCIVFIVCVGIDCWNRIP